MASTKIRSYHYKLFIPIVTTLWVLIAIIGIFHYTRSESIRQNALRTNVDIISGRVVNIYETRNDDSALNYISFIEKYFKSTDYYDLSISIYNAESGDMICAMGFPIKPPVELKNAKADHEFVSDRTLDPLDPEKAFYYSVRFTSDKRILVQTLMPDCDNHNQALMESMWFFIFLFILGLLITFSAYLFTSYLAQNIENLRRFVDCAVKDKDFDQSMKFPDDELGEISRQIVHLYIERSNAISQIEREHREAILAAEERVKRRRQLTNNLNHELKTPLGIIKGYVETLLSTPDIDPETRKHFLEKTHNQVLRLQDILNDIATISRLDEGKTSIRMDKVDFYSLTLDLASEVIETGLNEGFKIIIDMPADCIVKGDENLLAAMLLNLTKNAVIHSGGSEIGLTLVDRDDNEYKFSFYDDGCGVKPDHLPYLFDRFYRADAGRSRRVGGTGLGLSIVRHTITSMGGKIMARNRAGGGLEIIFTLPVWKDGDEKPDNENSNETTTNNE